MPHKGLSSSLVAAMKPTACALAIILLLVLAQQAHAAALDGAAMKWPFALPFAGLLLSIAAGPLLFPTFWHAHYGKAAGAWAVLTARLDCMACRRLGNACGLHACHAGRISELHRPAFRALHVAGGIVVSGDIRGTPWNNAAMLALGTAMASVVGTTGAAMILIRPLIRANITRRYNTHVVIFFIILVANVGGALSPLGDPPLFVGFLQGVEFFWTTRNLWVQTAIVAALLLAIFIVLDFWCYRSEPAAKRIEPPNPVRIRGLVNLGWSPPSSRAS